MTITIISTGGTIASVGDAGEGASPSLSGREVVDAVPDLDLDVDVHEFSSVPSPHFTVEQMLRLTDAIRAHDDDTSVDGVVVTHGTDVLEETAYFVDLCYDGDTPVVFTGAMRTPSVPSPDGPANLLASARVAASDGARGRGVLVAFNERVHPAREVTKVNSTRLDTFRSPEFGPLAVTEEDRVVWRRSAERVDDVFRPSADALTNDVLAVTATADMPVAQLEAGLDSAAVCLAATGAGHVPPAVVPALRDLRAAGVPLVATTRCPEGRLARHTYDFPGSETTLQEVGALYSDLPLQKTRIRAVVGIASGALEAAFDRPY